jgi:similar to stage IV sporulation protein
VNDVVKPGQILISGILGNEEYSTIDTARGIVEGEVWYESEIEVPLKQNRPILTGDNYKEKYLTIGNWNLKISGYFQKPFSHAVKTEESATLPWLKKYFTLGVKTVTYQEDTIHESLINEAEASALGKRFARENLLKKLDASARIKDEIVLHQRLENGKVYIKIHYVVIENIAKEQLIDLNQIKENKGE